MKRSRTITFPAAALALVAGWACGEGEDGSAPQQPLITEEVGGAIDAELSTEEDRRGPRWVDSGRVLPPGFPADLALPVGSLVTESGTTGEGENFVVVETRDAPSKLAADWVVLIESEAWEVSRVSDTHVTARKSEQTVRAVIAPFGSGSRLRIVYR